MKRSPTEFSHVFESHDPDQVWIAVESVLEELNRKKAVKIRWAEGNQDLLVFNFQTKARPLKYNDSDGYNGEGNCRPRRLGGTELNLYLEKAASDGGSLIERRGYDWGQRQDIWDAILNGVINRLSYDNPPIPFSDPAAAVGREDHGPSNGQAGRPGRTSAGAPVQTVEATTDTGPDTLQTHSTNPISTTAGRQANSTEDLLQGKPTPVEVKSLPLGERLDLIERLGSLTQRGYLSQTEFSEQKARLIYG